MLHEIQFYLWLRGNYAFVHPILLYKPISICATNAQYKETVLKKLSAFIFLNVYIKKNALLFHKD